MGRHSRGSVLDITIRGDDLEHDRIQLENNLQNTNLSFRLSSVSDDEEEEVNSPVHDSSVEYPRHYSGPSPFTEFPSFTRRSGDHYDEDGMQDHTHGWSYRTGDDDEGINPYGGETVSTAAHHASALTLNAGLGGGRGVRREISLSGAEYDPDRPLHEMIAGVDRYSAIGMDTTRSKQGMGSVNFDPVVVENTEELDRILESGYAPPASLRSQSRSVPFGSPLSSATSSTSDSESGQPHNGSRPKLSDALRRVSFSPKRPRSPQISKSQLPPINAISPRMAVKASVVNSNASMNAPTPKASRRSNLVSSYVSSPVAQPEVRLQPPTPSSTSSKFTRMARGITKELEAERQSNAEKSRPASAPPAAEDRNPFSITNSRTEHSFSTSSRRRVSEKSVVKNRSKSKIHLPDVTGLTSAVESPAKLGVEYLAYHANNRSREYEARILHTLNSVQAKLQHLEDENSISRRRVRELELELEECKREVARERTRLIQQEEVIIQQQYDLSMNASRRSKGKGRAKDITIVDESIKEKYMEVVEEKKALEALIHSLQSHLTRLTSELSSHRELLMELRNLRESDAQAIRQKSDEINWLKEEVERLGGEVEVLRGVIEEGLKERRSTREVSVQLSVADIAMSHDSESDNEEVAHEMSVNGQNAGAGLEEGNDDRDRDDDEDEAEPFDPQSLISSLRDNAQLADRTMRTDHATLGSSALGVSTPGQFVTTEDLERISTEIEERRSNISSTGSVASNRRSATPEPTRRNRRVVVEDDGEGSDEERQTVHHHPRSKPQHQHHQQQQQQQRATNLHSGQGSSRPTAQNAGQPARHKQRVVSRSAPKEPETPFPQIRGEHLERLFFSAPEHNAKTCTVCHRRRHRPGAMSPTMSTHPLRRNDADEASDASESEDEDEGFAEGSEPIQREAQDNGKRPELVQDGVQMQLPPQTVVARLIRELEDDFTHYKSVYVELADQYKDMDAASNVLKRNTLAQHLREVVDILEQKGDQIASLYDLLTFKDKPATESVIPKKFPSTSGSGPTYWGRNAHTQRRIPSGRRDNDS